MRRIKYYLVVIATCSVFLIGCNSDDGIALDNEVNEFVWLAMNQFYFWQSSVPELDDAIANNRTSLNEFLNNYSSPEVLFDDLKFRDDRFSILVDDYEALEASFEGLSSFGYEFRLLNPTGTNIVYGFVKYVAPSSPAAQAGLIRGDIFTKVDGLDLNLDNYFDLLFRQSSYSLTLAEVSEGEIVSTDETRDLVGTDFFENPIHLSKVIDVSGVKVGYLVYNQFINTNEYHTELNQVFGGFASEGVTEMVLDLRYNLGGSVLTSQMLASMLNANGSTNDVFVSFVYNEKLNEIFSEIDLNTYFIDAVPETNESLNRLNLSRIFILTSGSTASSSELIISGLLPYMDVTLIGTSTVGKNEGSVTLYDSPSEAYLERGSDLNPNHKYALQPIINQFANAEGFTDYIDGFTPDITIDEKDLLGEIEPLGDENEHLLAEALAIISGSARTSPVAPRFDITSVYDSHERKKHIQTVKIDIDVILSRLKMQ